MPEVGKKSNLGKGGEVEALSLINSGSHYIALPKKGCNEKSSVMSTVKRGKLEFL